ncbi:hypothetical protein BH20ACI4_BH20ACI4_34580 [soil metagenome]
MKYRLADDAKPQVKLLLLATLITVVLWFIPYADYLVYPVRLFVTFIHEGSHVLASLLTGGSVQSLSVASDGSGMVQSLTSSPLSVLITSSAGYLGAIAYGTLLLFLIRRAYSARVILAASAGFIGLMTVLFGLFAPLWNVFSIGFNLTGLAFTVISGALLTAALLAISKFASDWWANFTLAFLAVQCLLNAVFDLTTLFLINSPLVGSHIHSDAANMAAVTGLPSIVWVMVWIGVSILLISVGLRVYAVSNQTKQHDLPFED